MPGTSSRYPRVGEMRNAVQYNGGDMVDTLAAQGFRFHSQFSCRRSEACVIHNASDHHMNRWPRNVRSSALVERLCSHAVGHPDPDSVAFFESVGKDGFDIHGCDGCCAAEATLDIWKKTIVVVEVESRRTEVALDADGWVRISGDSITPELLKRALDALTS